MSPIFIAPLLLSLFPQTAGVASVRHGNISAQHEAAAEHEACARWPISERALLGAVLVDNCERRLGTVRDALFDGRSGRVLHLAILPRAERGRDVHLERRQVQWEFDQQRFATHLGPRELARRPAAQSVLRSPARAQGVQPFGAAWSSAAPEHPVRPVPALFEGSQPSAEHTWSLAGLLRARILVGADEHPIEGLVLDAQAGRVLAVLVAQGERELALPPAALGRSAQGHYFLRAGSRTLAEAPALAGPALEAFAEPDSLAAWDAFWYGVDESPARAPASTASGR